MPPRTPRQQRAAGAALAAKRGQEGLRPGSASAQMAKGMSEKQLKEFATKPKGGYPGKKKKK
jgi:hypothetical protein